jgi:hypothetical protein
MKAIKTIAAFAANPAIKSGYFNFSFGMGASDLATLAKAKNTYGYINLILGLVRAVKEISGTTNPYIKPTAALVSDLERIGIETEQATLLEMSSIELRGQETLFWQIANQIPVISQRI